MGFWRKAAFMTLCVVALGAAHAEDRFPSHPVRMVVSYAAGGPTDIVARIVSARMGEALGQPVNVENRPGLGGNLGAEAVMKAPPDGYTLLVATIVTHAINPLLYRKGPYDPVRDFAPIGQIGITPSVLVVNSAVPAKDVKALVAMIRTEPGRYSYGSSGVGSMLHLCGESFKMSAGGLDLKHVAYRGAGAMMTGLLEGQIPIAFDPLPTALPAIQAGKIRPLAIGAAVRSPALSDVPTMQEAGYGGFECYTWTGLFAPAGTPKPIIVTLNDALTAALRDPATIKRLHEAGVDPSVDPTPERLGEFVKAELRKWAPVVKASGAAVN